LEALYFTGNQKAMMKTGMTTIAMSPMAARMRNLSDSPMGPLGLNRSIELQPARKVKAPRDNKPTKTTYFFLFIYPPTPQGSLHSGKINADQIHLVTCRIIRISERSLPHLKNLPSAFTDAAHFSNRVVNFSLCRQYIKINVKNQQDNYRQDNCLTKYLFLSEPVGHRRSVLLNEKLRPGSKGCKVSADINEPLLKKS